MKISIEKLRTLIRDILEEDVRKVKRGTGYKYCVYVDDKVTRKDQGQDKKAGRRVRKLRSIKRTKKGKVKMKARACFNTRKKANNAMAAAMM